MIVSQLPAACDSVKSIRYGYMAPWDAADLELMRTPTNVDQHRTINRQQRFRTIEKLSLPHTRYPIANLVFGIASNLIKLFTVFGRSIGAISSRLFIAFI
jgi:hypothetical protein